MGENTLLDAGLLGRLENYRLVRQRPVPGAHPGPRRSLRKGGAVEFADYREYTAGDEPRRVDWKAYARLGRLYVKEFQDERQDSVLFLIDTSASMDWGDGDEHKGRYALRLAAGLGTCVLAGNDRLAIVAGAVSAAEPGNPAGVNRGGQSGVQAIDPLNGRRSLPRLWNRLGEISFGGGTDLPGCLQAGLQVLSGAAGLYVFSDLWDPQGVEDMLRLAAGRGMAVTLMHILAPGELNPPGEGEWTLVDAETGARVDVSFTPAAMQDYARRLGEFFRQLDHSCRRWGARRLLLDTGAPFAQTLLHTLPRLGVLKTY
ncbi:DUF58 domain-containing protein [Desulfoscipio geothermicus]|uniref:DUF58 domain-containing protein n=1 Tax=Desulfoscipio geothermicus DSM 3669 TaxID=1121426 RepID=A0A1I6E9H5_9FIRM|nr:DUF58 domain-containing protein [Desulfoscipio geothermicus]SFR14379.1 Protein of unknown function DUF58 [Desulfoscipio geothermicus DSM 3669]